MPKILQIKPLKNAIFAKVYRYESDYKKANIRE
jgi:hypothetical protein